MIAKRKNPVAIWSRLYVYLPSTYGPGSRLQSCEGNLRHSFFSSGNSSKFYSTSRSLSRDKDTSTTRNAEKVRTETQKRAEAAAARARAQVSEQTGDTPSQGSLASNSLFSETRQIAALQKINKGRITQDEAAKLDPSALELRNPARLGMAINPRPMTRTRGLRRMVIRSVRQRGRLTKTVKLARSERFSLSRSHFFKTSMKKLAPLARQIAGKPIDEAILQMRFSKKKVAQEVREHLIEARNEAVVRKGLGLPQLQPVATEKSEPGITNDSRTEITSTSDAPSTGSTASITTSPNTETSIETTTPAPTPTPTPAPPPKYLPGTTIPSQPLARSPTSIYIAQSWINRGPYGQDLNHRAFGRIDRLRPPHTGISVLLKEEKTRMREARDKEEKKIRKRMGKNMWTQLPDRKITRQSQYLLW